jgi:pimeloyl-ACP methyl ester carboxylesterase
LYTQKVKLDLSSGEIAEIDAVYQDTLPAEGSSLSLGTVVTIHGSPGSHNDFKYVVPHLRAAGIRVIGVNFPGLGYSSYDHRMRNNNAERTQFIKRLLAQTGVHKNIVFMGHSRLIKNWLTIWLK